MAAGQMSGGGGDAGDAQKPVNELKTVRAWLAIGVTGLSILLAAVLGFAVIRISHTANAEAVRTSKDVLNVMLPLLGTWVGSVLAFYFSKENFEAATRSVADMAKQVSSLERLKSISVKDKMISKFGMHFKVLPDDRNRTLAEILNEMHTAGKGQRLPILSNQGVPLHVIHRSTIDRYLADKALAPNPPALNTLTLENLLTDKADALKATFATVREEATLADAKAAMDAVPSAQDVFVTASGKPDGAVIGWITNVIIQDNSRV